LRFFDRKKRRRQNQCKFLSIKAKAGLARALKNVLTAKKGLFWGVLTGKQGVGARKRAFYFALFHVLVVFLIASRCITASYIGFDATKKLSLKHYGRFFVFGGFW